MPIGRNTTSLNGNFKKIIDFLDGFHRTQVPQRLSWELDSTTAKKGLQAVPLRLEI